MQTAYAGDVVLVTPLAMAVSRYFHEVEVHFLVNPDASVLLKNNPSINRIWIYDKRGEERGIRSFFQWIQNLKQEHFDVALIPHRSIRSALMIYFAGIPRRIGFDRSTGSSLFTDVVKYSQDLHEVERNLSLLHVLGWNGDIPCPKLYPGHEEKNIVDRFFKMSNLSDGLPVLAVSPGSVWPTKRWPPKRFAEVIRHYYENLNIPSILIGGQKDQTLADEIVDICQGKVHNTVGQFSLLASAELIRRCRAIVCNDSAPLHLAVAVGTPAVAIFGPTTPQFGFYPWGEGHFIIQKELTCRPCSIHGGKQCPEKHFRCMIGISTVEVIQALDSIIK